ncbi:MAG: class I SAM-dependent methyltransferase [Verrucomicrobia bacterium]|nr:MAG: class I SAM-dependent methyltransferase [Verrucomicrobiota bacterium]
MFQAAFTKLYRNLVLETLHRGRRGTLRLTMPGGSSRMFGGLDKELHAEIKIKNEAFYRRWVLYGSIGLAESYLHNEWETNHLTGVIAWFFLNASFLSGEKVREQGLEKHNILGIANQVQHLLRHCSKKKKEALFYDQSNVHTSFFQHWLGTSMAYSAAYFKTSTESLTLAQEAKWERLCQKLLLTAHDYLLDIGCSWGGFAIYAAQKYGCRIQATTLSEEQYRQTDINVEKAGVANLVEVVFCNYQHLGGRFDKIACIEMMDLADDPDLEPFFAKIESLLAPQGLLVLQLVLCPDNQYPFLRDNVDFVQKYITPRTLTPSLRRLTEACNETGNLNLLDCEDITPSAARTMALWRTAFTSSLPKMQKQGCSTLFLRKWFYYLCYCEAAFATRSKSTVQALYSRPTNLTLKSPIYMLPSDENPG